VDLAATLAAKVAMDAEHDVPGRGLVLGHTGAH